MCMGGVVRRICKRFKDEHNCIAQDPQGFQFALAHCCDARVGWSRASGSIEHARGGHVGCVPRDRWERLPTEEETEQAAVDWPDWS